MGGKDQEIVVKLINFQWQLEGSVSVKTTFRKIRVVGF